MPVKKSVKSVKKSKELSLDVLLEQDCKANLKRMGMTAKEIKDTCTRNTPKSIAQALREIATEKHGAKWLKNSVPVLIQSQSPAKDVWEIRIMSAASVEGYQHVKQTIAMEQLKEMLHEQIESVLSGKKGPKISKKTESYHA